MSEGNEERTAEATAAGPLTYARACEVRPADDARQQEHTILAMAAGMGQTMRRMLADLPAVKGVRFEARVTAVPIEE